MILADRAQALTTFKQLLHSAPKSQSNDRILLIQAPSGLGKTCVLSNFYAHCPTTHHCVSIDLRTSEEGIMTVWFDLVRAFGYQIFRTFMARVNGLSRSNIDVRGNRIEGEGNLFQVLLDAPDPVERQIRFQQLQTAFFQDLRTIQRPVLFLIDHFEEAPREVQHWISVQFLSQIAQLTHFFAVVAGVSLPKASLVWSGCSKTLKLKPIVKADDWLQFLSLQSVAYSPATVTELVEKLQGHPTEIRLALEEYLEEVG
jgi:hypothetical protein